jgi:hypothetical protein
MFIDNFFFEFFFVGLPYLVTYIFSTYEQEFGVGIDSGMALNVPLPSSGMDKTIFEPTTFRL